VGWPLSSALIVVYMLRNRSLPLIASPMGPIRAFAGPFEVLDIEAMSGAARLFDVINILQILAGWWLWKSRRRGGILAFSLLGSSAVFWWGFGLPIPPLVGLLLAGLLAKGWKSLS
jgi:hypothetical protein